MTTEATGPAFALQDVNVLILGGAVCYSGRLLAGMGATVLLVEPPQGCPERRSAPFAPGPLGPNSSLTFAFHAAGLRSIAVDAATADGEAVLRASMEPADVCLDALGWENPSPWVEACQAALAATTTTVCDLNPGGDLAGIGADDLLIQAASGLMAISGFAEGPPIPAPAELARMQSGLFGATAALAALRGDGLRNPAITVPAQAALSLTTLQTSNPGYYTWNGRVPKRAGVGGLGGNPLRCKDGFTTFTVPGERWPAFLAWLADEGIATDSLPERLDGQVSSMLEALTAARPVLEQLASRKTKQEFYHSAQGRGLLAMPVNTISGVLEDDHLRARGFFVTDAQGAAELAAPFRSQPELWRLDPAAPGLGDYTEQWLSDRLGYTRGAIESLHAMGAILCGH